MELISEEDVIKLWQPLNNHASVVRIEISGKIPLYWFERKTPGYPAKNFEGTLCKIGGNWRKAEEETPLETLGGESGVEIKDYRILRELLANAKPVGDYFSHVPREVHGNPKQDYPYNFTFSLYEAKINRNYFSERFDLDEESFSAGDLERALTQVQQYPPAVISLQQFMEGLKEQICWGYDQVMSEYLEERYGFKPKIRLIEGIVVRRLESSPETPYRCRGLLKYYRSKPNLEDVSDLHTFGMP